VTDRIVLFCTGSAPLLATLASQREYIMRETLAVDMSFSPSSGEHSSTFDLNGEEVTVGLRRRSAA
jgi:hypothetical protein